MLSNTLYLTIFSHFNICFSIISPVFVYCLLGEVSTTAGVHRLLCHKSYKATWQLRTLLMILNASIFQNSGYHWARDHRVHHKLVDCDGDPYNVSRGFFHAHLGWLMIKKRPKTINSNIDMSDLEQDPIIMFQHKFVYENHSDNFLCHNFYIE